MHRFVELTSSRTNQKLLISATHITSIYLLNDDVCIVAGGDKFTVTDSFDEVAQKINYAYEGEAK